MALPTTSEDKELGKFFIDGAHKWAFGDLPFHDLDEEGVTTYIGKGAAGFWMISQLIESGKDLTMRYANIKNNSSYSTYSAAWTNRATLNYDLLENI